MFLKRIEQADEGNWFNATPLVDVMFNLLIFIIVTAQYTNIQSLKVSLPKAESGTAIEKKESFSVTITNDEVLFFEGKPISLMALAEEFQKMAANKEQPYLMIQSDESATTGKLIGVMDLASKAGLKKISIETRKD